MCYAGYFERDSRRSLLVGEVDRGRGGLRSDQLGAPAALNPTLACEGLPIPKVGACSGLLHACGDGGSTVFLKVNCLRVCTSSCFLLLLHLLLVLLPGVAAVDFVDRRLLVRLDCSAHAMSGAVLRLRMRCRCCPRFPTSPSLLTWSFRA